MGALDLMSTWPVGRSAAAVVSPRGVLASRGATDDRFLWASVTKLASSLAVLVAVEEGTVALGDPAGPPGSSVAHLLSHASGLAPSAREVLAPPGERRIYSNAGFEVLSEEVAARSSMPFEQYLADAVFGPLDMSGAALGAGASAASAVTGTVGDLAALAAELLTPSLISPATSTLSRSVAFGGLAGVLPGFGFMDPCDWGLGPELRDGKSPHWTGPANSAATFGHFGVSGCFVWVDPVAEVACAVLTDTAFGGWAATAWPALSDAVVAEFAVGRG